MFSSSRTVIFLLHLVLATNCSANTENESNTTEFNYPTYEREIDDFVPHPIQAFNSFDWAFWKVINKGNYDNALISPLSVKLGLTLLYEGADDQTANELALALNLPASRPAIRDLISDLLKSLNEPSPDYILNVGTRLYIDLSIVSKLRYKAIAKTFYETDVKNVNFSDTRSIASDVNNWARILTQGNIDLLIEDESRLQDSVLLLTSALFFKGTWKNHPFSKDNTMQDTFLSPTGIIIGDYMRADSYFYFYYCNELEAKFLRLPYKGSKYAMYIILPDDNNTLDNLIEKLNPDVLNKIVWNMEKLPVDVKIPKFKFEASNHLEQALREMGIKEVFTNKATLSGFAYSQYTDGNLYVSDIIHKAGIEVNEEGTSAFATTEIEIGNKNSGMSFYATHPFMFYIEDESTAAILYMGKVNNPFDATPSSSEPPQVPDSSNNNMINIDEAYGNLDMPSIGLNDRNNYFNMELAQTLYKEHEGNLIVSPLSVKAALMTLIEGTDGRTQLEILSALRLPTNLSDIRSVADRDLQILKDISENAVLNLANRVWVGENVKVSKEYNRTLQNYYGSDLSSVDFKNPDSAVAAINSWVKKKTDNHIQSVVDLGSLESETKLLLTSAVHFKSQWKNSFLLNHTREGCFKIFAADCKFVPMMENFDMYKYANIPALDAQVLEIPYENDKFSLLLILPNKHGKEFLDTLSQDLSYIPISLLLKNLELAEIQLQLPKFHIENKLNLKQTLSKLGVKDLFSIYANMTSALPDSPYYVSDVFQDVKIEVNENGTEASAVTELTVVPLMATSDISFRANRPFLFSVIDKSRNSILFSGRLIEP